MHMTPPSHHHNHQHFESYGLSERVFIENGGLYIPAQVDNEDNREEDEVDLRWLGAVVC